MELIVNLCEIDFVVQFDIFGKYYPATRWEPEELPEIDILSIEVAPGQEEMFKEGVEMGDFDENLIETDEFREQVYDILYDAYWKNKMTRDDDYTYDY